MISRVDANSLKKFNWNNATIRFGVKIGTGTYAHVFRGTYQKLVAVDGMVDAVDIDIAIKIPTKKTVFSPDPIGHENATMQYIMSILDKDPTYRECFVTYFGYRINGRFEQLILGLANSGDWMEWLIEKNRDVSECRTIVLHVAQALSVLHQNDMVFCDLKPENVLLHRTDRLQAKLADFGGTNLIRTTGRNKVSGTLLFFAPECVVKNHDPDDPRGTFNTPESDMFSFGMCLLMAVSGHEDPLDLQDRGGNMRETAYYIQRLYRIIVDEPIDPSFTADIVADINTNTLELYRLAMWCMAKVPAHRPTAEIAIEVARGKHTLFFVQPKINHSDAELPKLGSSP